MRRCGRCGIEKALSELHRDRKRGSQAWCKVCRREFDAAYWQATKKHRMAKRRRRYADLMAWHNELKSRIPCADCRGSFHPAAMSWDHLPGSNKLDDVSSMFRRQLRMRTILVEIAKCELVCANCHAVRTFERRGVAQPG
jgi:hypothetical protein